MRASLALVVATAALSGSADASLLHKSSDSVKLADEKNLVLYSGKMTTARRSPPVPQVHCMGGPCHEAKIDYVQCENMGNAGQMSIQWKCTAYPEMPMRLSLADVDVSCEGYSYRGDSNVLRGSCGVRFTIKDKEAPWYKSGGHYQGYFQQAYDATYPENLIYSERARFPVFRSILSLCGLSIFYRAFGKGHLDANKRRGAGPIGTVFAALVCGVSLSFVFGLSGVLAGGAIGALLYRYAHRAVAPPQKYA